MEQEKNNKQKSFIKPVLRFVVSFGLIGLILYLFREQLPAVFQHLKSINPFYFLAAVIIFFLGLIGVAYRLRLVVMAQQTELSPGLAYYVNLIALFFNNVLPSSVGGEMVKAYYLYKNANGKVSAFSAVIVDRLFGIVTMIFISMSAVLFWEQAQSSPRILSSIIFLTLFIITFGVLVFNKKIADSLCQVHIPLVPGILLEKIRDIYKAIHDYRGHKRIVLRCVFLTLVGQGAYIIANYLLARSLSIDISLGFFFFFVPIMLLIGVAPSVNGIGVREATFLFYLNEFTSPEKALALSLLSTFFLIFIGIIGGIIYAFKGGVPITEKNINLQ
jgi:uncharacterized protein (TIRG00374 family)